MRGVDEFATLAAVWILASNDERSLITYRGLQQRLQLSDVSDLKRLVAVHPELFRRNLPPTQLAQWKQEMLKGKRLPAWIREQPEREWPNLIASISTEDGFRSQFRSALDSPQSPIAIIEWGLSHIERLRKAQNEAREATAKSWQVWAVFIASILGTIVSVVAALHGKK